MIQCARFFGRAERWLIVQETCYFTAGFWLIFYILLLAFIAIGMHEFKRNLHSQRSRDRFAGLTETMSAFAGIVLQRSRFRGLSRSTTKCGPEACRE